MLKHSDMPLRVNRTNCGFTLVEVMVALVIFSFVMVMLFSSFNSFISTGQTIANGVDYNERARDVFRRILDDLTDMYVPESNIIRVQSSVDGLDVQSLQMTGEKRSVGGETFSTLEFACLSALQTGRSGPSGIVHVTYYVRKNSRELFNLHRAERPIGSGRNTDPCSDPVLAENISAFTIDFIDAKRNEYQDWDPDKDGGQAAIPRALNIGLTLKSEGKEKVFQTAVVLPIQGQAGE
ncbi:MAG: prepilin-type cleavage/methylation domain-containing protein [Desulfobacter postgatei]|uniref:Prepilin-type cleavage/methylation domain-containing protein n=1 Tax=Desulfobacter postgatei TaxID=2293 RepID=A0A2G6MQW8_9BACT|nr:MAG: prepilin-type cleavage/methylation domain-containing protein [Desulfobacter postgatei]